MGEKGCLSLEKCLVYEAFCGTAFQYPEDRLSCEDCLAFWLTVNASIWDTKMSPAVMVSGHTIEFLQLHNSCTVL